MVSIKIPCHFQVGAGGGTRTRMPKALDPKSSASTNFATPAHYFFGVAKIIYFFKLSKSLPI